MKKIIITIVLIISTLFVHSQSINYKKESKKPNANYYEIVKKVRAEPEKAKLFKKQSLTHKKVEKQFERWAFFWKDRVYADGSFPKANIAYINAGIIDKNGKFAQINTSKNREAQDYTWRNIGAQSLPKANGFKTIPQMGRLDAFLYFKNSPKIYFVGAPSGGAWKTTDDGKNWTPLLDEIAGIGVNDIASAATSYSNNTIIYVSTGDYDNEGVNSIGVLKSTDGGNTFQSTNLIYSLSDKKIVSNLIVIDDNTVIVGTNDDIYKTIDGGKNWSKVHSSDASDDKYGRFVRTKNDIYCSTDYGAVLYSSDLGETWTEIKKGTENAENDLALSIDDNDNVNIIDPKGQISKYNGNIWIKVGIPVPDFSTQDGYNQTLVFDNKLIIAAGVNGYHSIDNGKSWYKSLNDSKESALEPGTYVHADHHRMGKLDDDPNSYRYWVCNDGGLSFIEYKNLAKTTNPNVTYKSEKCIVTQIYSVSINPYGNFDNIVQGNQDNDAFSKEMHNGTIQWLSVESGDAVCTAINYNDTDERYVGGPNGLLSITDRGFSGNYRGIIDKTIEGADFSWPLEMNTVDPNKLYAGGDDVYLIDATTTEYDITPLDAGFNDFLLFIRTHENSIFALTNDEIRKSLDGGKTWTALNQANANDDTFINSIDFSQTNNKLVYASLRGYIDGEKTYMSSDGGKTWTNISEGLPNVVTKEILLVQNKFPSTLFLATEIGVYIKNDNQPWKKLGDASLPNVDTPDIDINYVESSLVAATYGRGLWKTDISNILGIKNQEITDKNIISIYPNPSSNIINIEITSNNFYTYIIYNAVGGLIKKGNLPNSIDISDLPFGVYIFKINKGDKTIYSKKIIKK